MNRITRKVTILKSKKLTETQKLQVTNYCILSSTKNNTFSDSVNRKKKLSEREQERG